MENLNTKGYNIEDDYSGDADNYHRNKIRHPNGQIVRDGIYDCDLKKVLNCLPDVSDWDDKKIKAPSPEVANDKIRRKLVLVMEPKEGDTRHTCYNGACPFYQKTANGEMGKLCKTLWGTAPTGKHSLSSLCNYYEIKNVVVAEVDESSTIAQILNRDTMILVRE